MQCVILDDEPLALDLLTKYVNDSENLVLAFASTDAFEAIKYIQNNKVDLIFLDVQMPELTGMQVLKIIGSDYNVILTTAYSDYAVESYNFNILDYVLKPITYERFLKAIDKVKQNKPKEMETINKPQDDFIFIKTDSKMVKVNLKELLFIEGLKDYISLQTQTEKLITLQNLKTLEDVLPKHLFMRVHKSFIVAINNINTIERNRIFINEHIIPIGDTYREEFIERIAFKK